MVVKNYYSSSWFFLGGVGFAKKRHLRLDFAREKFWAVGPTNLRKLLKCGQEKMCIIRKIFGFFFPGGLGSLFCQN